MLYDIWCGRYTQKKHGDIKEVATDFGMGKLFWVQRPGVMGLDGMDGMDGRVVFIMCRSMTVN